MSSKAYVRIDPLHGSGRDDAKRPSSIRGPVSPDTEILFAGSSAILDAPGAPLRMIYGSDIDPDASSASYFGLVTSPSAHTTVAPQFFAIRQTQVDTPDLSIAPEPKSLIFIGSALMATALLALKRAARIQQFQPVLE